LKVAEMGLGRVRLGLWRRKREPMCWNKPS